MISDFGVLGNGWPAANVAELANVAGLFVALVGMAFTLAQLVLLRRQLKLDALIRIMDSNRAIVTLGFEHPAVWTVLERTSPDPGPTEGSAARRYLQLWVNHMLILWMAWRLGLVSGGEWEAYRLDMTEFLRAPSLRAHWVRVSRFYPRKFQELIAGLCPCDLPASPFASASGREDEDCFRAQSSKP